jgi:Ion channel
MSRYQEVRFWILFVVLLGFLMLWPVALELSSRQLGQFGPGIVREILLLSWVLAVSNKARIAIVVLVLGIGVVVSRWLFESGFGMVFDNISHVLAIVIVLIVAVAILTEVLRAGEVTLHLVVGAVCVYLMLALLWTFLYDAIETLAPGAILVRAVSFPDTAKLPVADADLVKMLYFSLSTITTLGNSDITVTFFARQLAPIEAITGQLYLAVLIARLVGFSSPAGPPHLKPD